KVLLPTNSYLSTQPRNQTMLSLKLRIITPDSFIRRHYDKPGTLQRRRKSPRRFLLSWPAKHGLFDARQSLKVGCFGQFGTLRWISTKWRHAELAVNGKPLGCIPLTFVTSRNRHGTRWLR